MFPKERWNRNNGFQKKKIVGVFIRATDLLSWKNRNLLSKDKKRSLFQKEGSHHSNYIVL